MTGIRDFSTTANSNATVGSINWAEGQTAASVNNSARAQMAAEKATYLDQGGALTTAGTSNAFTLSTNQTVTSNIAGDVFAFKTNRTNTGAVTLQTGSATARAWVRPDGAAYASGQIVSGGFYVVAYDSANTRWVSLIEPRVPSFSSRSAFATWVAAGGTAPNGEIVSDGTVLYVATSGSTTIFDLNDWEPFGTFTPNHFGENTTPGTTDMTTAIQAAVTAATHEVVGLAQTYAVTGSISLLDKNGLRVDFSRSKIDATSFDTSSTTQPPDSIFEIIDTHDAITSAAANISKGAVTFNVSSATGIVAGQAVYIYSSGELWYTESTSGAAARSFISRVLSVSGTTVTIEHPFPYDMDATVTYTVTAIFWSGTKDVSIKFGAIDGPDFVENQANGAGEGIFTGICVQNIGIEFTRGAPVEGFQGGPVWFQNFYNCHVRGLDYEGLDADYARTVVEGQDAGFTGVWFNTGRLGTVRDGSFRRVRHAVDGTRAWDVTLENVFAFDCHRPPFGSHHSCENWVFINCYGSGGPGGWLWRGKSSTLIGCSYVGGPDTYGWYDTAGTAADIPHEIQITDCRFDVDRSALLLLANYSSFIVNGGSLKGGRSSTPYPVVDIQTKQYQDIQITGLPLRTEAGNDLIWVDNDTPDIRGSLIARRVIFDGYASNGIDFRTALSNTVLIVEDCTDRPGSGTLMVNTNSQTFASLKIGPNYNASGLTKYQHNTWTPALKDASGNEASYSSRFGIWSFQDGWYKLSFRFSLSSLGSLSGALRITGLPVTPANDASIHGSVTVSFASGLGLGAAGYSLTGRVIANADRVDLLVWGATSGTTSLLHSDLTSSAVIYGVIEFPAL